MRLRHHLCRHRFATIRFQHLTHRATGEWGVWYVNECRKCGVARPLARWQGRMKDVAPDQRDEPFRWGNLPPGEERVGW